MLKLFDGPRWYPFRATACMLVAVLGCTAGQTEPDPEAPYTGLRTLTILGRVGDSVGVPFGGVVLQMHVSASGDTVDLFRRGSRVNGNGTINITHYDDRPVLQQDLTGAMVFSLTGSREDGPCQAFEDTTWVQPYQRPASVIDDTVQIEVILRSLPLTTVTTGDLCGIGTDLGNLYLSLSIDSLADSVFGHWEVSFTATIGSRYGVFAGELQKTTLLLQLTDTVSSCADWRFVAPVDSLTRVIYPGWLTWCDGRPVPGRVWLRPGTH